MAFFGWLWVWCVCVVASFGGFVVSTCSHINVDSPRVTLETSMKNCTFCEAKNGHVLNLNFGTISPSRTVWPHLSLTSQQWLKMVLPPNPTKHTPAQPKTDTQSAATSSFLPSFSSFLPLPPSSSFVLLPLPFLLLHPPFRLPSSSFPQPSRPAQLAQSDDPANRATESRKFRKKVSSIEKNLDFSIQKHNQK